MLQPLGESRKKYSSSGIVIESTFCLSQFTKPLGPYSTLRVLWDAVGTLLVMFDIILTPLSVAWDGQDESMKTCDLSQ